MELVSILCMNGLDSFPASGLDRDFDFRSAAIFITGAVFHDYGKRDS